MKRILSSVLVCCLLLLCFAGCGKNKGVKANTYSRYNYTNGVTDTVILGDYKNITVDRSSEEYKKLLSQLMESDLSYYTQKIELGTVKDGDTANIDYAGSVGGVEFTGGTAKGYDLVIGSGSFIDDFEEQLIGVKIGDTKNVQVTFPKGYNSSTDLKTGSITIELSEKDAVFVVKVNYVNRPYTEVNDEFAKAAGFETADAYMIDLKERADKELAFSMLYELSDISALPDDTKGNSYIYFKNYFTNVAQQYGMTLESYISASGMTMDDFKREVLSEEMIIYACFDKLKLDIPENAVSKKAQEIADDYDDATENVVNYYTNNYLEFVVVRELTLDALLDVIKVTGE